MNEIGVVVMFVMLTLLFIAALVILVKSKDPLEFLLQQAEYHAMREKQIIELRQMTIEIKTSLPVYAQGRLDRNIADLDKVIKEFGMHGTEYQKAFNEYMDFCKGKLQGHIDKMNSKSFQRGLTDELRRY